LSEDPEKHTLSVVMAGERQVGKTALSARILARRIELGQATPSALPGSALPSHIEYATPRYAVRLFDPGPADDFLECVALADCAPDVVIVTANAQRGVQNPTRLQLRSLAETGVRFAVGFVSHCDSAPAERVSSTAQELRTLLDMLGFVAAPAILGATTSDGASAASVDALLDYLDGWERPLQRDTGFRMIVEGAMTVRMMGTLISGRIERGTLSVGQPVELVGVDGRVDTRATTIERDRITVKRARAGDFIYALLFRIDAYQISRGDLLASPGEVELARRFEADFYRFSGDEVGSTRTLESCAGYAVFQAATAPVRARAETPIEPGGRGRISIDLERARPLGLEAPFALRDGLDVLGIGRVTRTLPSSHS